MRYPREILEKTFFRLRGEALVGLVSLITGALLVWIGAGKLRILYHEFSVYFPLTLPANAGQVLIDSLPLIFKSFISALGSVFAVAIGGIWVISGLFEAFATGRQAAEVADYDRPELVAESLRLGESVHWQSYGMIGRVLPRLWKRARYISPVSNEILRQIIVSLFEICLILVAIAALFMFLHALPGLLATYAKTRIGLTIPSPAPLYLLLACVMAADVLIGISLIPLRKPRFARTSESMVVRGQGSANLFFALLEEGCQLLSPRGRAPKGPIRLEVDGNSRMKGSLIESFPEPIAGLSRPAGYLCLPIVPVLLVLGFSRLIDFNRPVASMPYRDFFSVHFLDYALEVAFALAMIACGIYFAEWARRLLTVTRYRSVLVFCHLTADEALPQDAKRSTPSAGHGRQGMLQWRPAEGADPRFAVWAKAPHGSGKFRVALHWAEVVWEAATDRGPRFLVSLQTSELIENSMYRLIQLPFRVAFQLEPVQREIPAELDQAKAASGKPIPHQP